MRFLHIILPLLVLLVLADVAGAVIPLEETPGSTAFIIARRSLLTSAAGDRLNHLERLLEERLRKTWQLDWKKLDEIGVVFGLEDQPVRLVLQGSGLDARGARSLLTRLVDGGIQTRTVPGGEVFSVDGLLDIESRPGQWVIHEGGVRYNGPTVAAQPFWRQMGASIHARSPELFLFTPVGSPVADAIGRMLGEPEFIREYRALALAVEEGRLILSVITGQDADQDRMVHALLRRIGKDPLLRQIIDPQESETGEVALKVTMNFRANGCQMLVEELLQKALELIPDQNELEEAAIRCDHRRRQLIGEIEKGILKPSGLNGRSTRSCPGGGRYFFRETTLGPQIRCSRHP